MKILGYAVLFHQKLHSSVGHAYLTGRHATEDGCAFLCVCVKGGLSR